MCCAPTVTTNSRASPPTIIRSAHLRKFLARRDFGLCWLGLGGFVAGGIELWTRVFGPLLQISRAAKRFGEGDLGARVRNRTRRRNRRTGRDLERHGGRHRIARSRAPALRRSHRTRPEKSANGRRHGRDHDARKTATNSPMNSATIGWRKSRATPAAWKR